MGDSGLRPYFELFDSFLGERISTAEFERRYLELFKTDNEMRPDPVFEILDGLFADVDGYSMEFGGEVDNLTEAQLRGRVAKVYRELHKYADPPGVEL